ncbi:hypothetical protein HK105_206784 [Polyrhizophydium stewartii]|uniref:Uncharacterized protein n=1 Tax=Polyrhizophydium stewartii TaxID=2732419 RepID=A0ABR4N2N5_9FUNG
MPPRFVTAPQSRRRGPSLHVTLAALSTLSPSQRAARISVAASSAGISPSAATCKGTATANPFVELPQTASLRVLLERELAALATCRPLAVAWAPFNVPLNDTFKQILTKFLPAMRTS